MRHIIEILSRRTYDWTFWWEYFKIARIQRITVRETRRIEIFVKVHSYYVDSDLQMNDRQKKKLSSALNCFFFFFRFVLFSFLSFFFFCRITLVLLVRRVWVKQQLLKVRYYLFVFVYSFACLFFFAFGCFVISLSYLTWFVLFIVLNHDRPRSAVKSQIL